MSISGKIIGTLGGAISIVLGVIKWGFIVALAIGIGFLFWYLGSKLSESLKERRIMKEHQKMLEELKNE